MDIKKSNAYQGMFLVLFYCNKLGVAKAGKNTHKKLGREAEKVRMQNNAKIM